MSDVVIRPGLTIPAGELAVAFARSGGPGGQNVNKVASKVELRWHPGSSVALGESDRAYILERLANKLTNEGVLIVTSTLTRDQLKNRKDAESKLALVVRTALDRPKTRRPSRPSRNAKRRRVEDKRHRSETKRNRRGDD